ncbi:PstS family phosphate ABC transporter substrate-binding protein [Paenibacillus sp. CAU 1782]
MKRSSWENVGLFVVFAPMIALVGFVLWVGTAIFISDRLYTYLIPVAVIAGIALLAIGLLGGLKGKWGKRLIGALLIAAILTIAGNESVKLYHKSFGVVGSEVSLYAYKPFTKGTKAVSLDEEPAFKSGQPLPAMDGATALYPLYSSFAQAVYPEGDYNPSNSKVRSSKTPEAYASLIKGEADIIFVAGPSDMQLQNAKTAGVEMKLTPLGKEAFVFFVHKDNLVTGLTTEQVKEIYSGKLTNWSQLGGKNGAIKAFQRPEDSGSQTALQRLMGETELMEPLKEEIAGGMGGIISQTADYRNYPGAIGYSFLFYATEMVGNGKIRLLEIDGIAPTRENISNGTYPLASNFYAVTTDSDNPNLEGLLEWITSEQGQKIVEKVGYTPVGNN